MLLVSVLLQLFSSPDLQARKITSRQSLRMKVFSPELGEAPETGTVVKKDPDGRTLTLALDGESGTP